MQVFLYVLTRLWLDPIFLANMEKEIDVSQKSLAGQPQRMPNLCDVKSKQI